MSKNIDEHEGKKYKRLIYSALPDNTRPPITIDVYCVLEAFQVTCPARQHAIKKLLAAGLRDKGSQLDDLIGAEAALARAIDMERVREEVNSKTHLEVSVDGVRGRVSKQLTEQLRKEVEL